MLNASLSHLVLTMAFCKLSKVSWWYSCVPWLKLNLATLIPAHKSSSNTSTVRDFGPRVQMIYTDNDKTSVCVCV